MRRADRKEKDREEEERRSGGGLWTIVGDMGVAHIRTSWTLMGENGLRCNEDMSRRAMVVFLQDRRSYGMIRRKS